MPIPRTTLAVLRSTVRSNLHRLAGRGRRGTAAQRQSNLAVDDKSCTTLSKIHIVYEQALASQKRHAF